MTWITRDNKIIASQEDLPDNCFGFVYKIVNLSKEGKFYVGKKQCFSVVKKKFGKKKLIGLNNRSKKYEMVTKESNWAKYNGSNIDLLEDIKNGDQLSKVILEFSYSKYHNTFLEVKHQFIEGVLESENSYNNSILGKFYRNVFNFTDTNV